MHATVYIFSLSLHLLSFLYPTHNHMYTHNTHVVIHVHTCTCTCTPLRRMFCIYRAHSLHKNQTHLFKLEITMEYTHIIRAHTHTHAHTQHTLSPVHPVSLSRGSTVIPYNTVAPLMVINVPYSKKCYSLSCT